MDWKAILAGAATGVGVMTTALGFAASFHKQRREGDEKRYAEAIAMCRIIEGPDTDLTKAIARARLRELQFDLEKLQRGHDDFDLAPVETFEWSYGVRWFRWSIAMGIIAVLLWVAFTI